MLRIPNFRISDKRALTSSILISFLITSSSPEIPTTVQLTGSVTPWSSPSFTKLTLSSISTTCSYSDSGRLISRSNILGRDWFPMNCRSANPFVVTKATLCPFLSSNAFVATVVPMRIESMRVVSTRDARG